MNQFLTLPAQTGEGPYHFNRFRLVFRPRTDRSKGDLAADFIANFPRYFNSPFANVEFDTQHAFGNAKLLKFHGFSKDKDSFDLASPHHDWVVVVDSDPSSGFLVQTLERTFRLPEDAKMAAMGAGGGAMGGALAGAAVGAVAGAGIGAGPGAAGGAILGGITAATAAYHANFRHFLAGRRAWRVDNAGAFGVDGDWLILETAAVERFSCEFYRLNDKAQGLGEKVPLIWNAMLDNYRKLNAVEVRPAQTLPGWLSNTATQSQYIMKSFDGLHALKADPEFMAASSPFPYLLPPELR